MKLHKLKTGLVHGVVFWTTRSLSASLQKLSSSTKAVEALILDGHHLGGCLVILSQTLASNKRLNLNIIFPANGPQNTCCTRKKLCFQSCCIYVWAVLAVSGTEPVPTAKIHFEEAPKKYHQLTNNFFCKLLCVRTCFLCKCCSLFLLLRTINRQKSS